MKRRTFIKHIGYGGAALPLLMPRLVRAASANGKLNIAGVGVGNKGYGDVVHTAKGQNVVAICDVDEGPQHLGRAAATFPDARRYVDWRKLLDESNDIDAITVSTPDHMHAPVTMSAMQLGKHVYCQKPMTHALAECRAIANAAANSKLITQVGIQHHATIAMRMLVKFIQDGVIGKVREVHLWNDQPGAYWPVGKTPAATGDPVPTSLHWDLWLGVAKPRAYIDGFYHPKAWRAWADFGGGSVGDNGSHIVDPMIWSLGLDAPRSVRHEGPPAHPGGTFPPWSIIRWQFAGTQYTAGETLNVTWYDGGKTPDSKLINLPEGRRLPKLGNLYIGTEGSILFSLPPTAPELLPHEKFAGFEYPKFDPIDHYLQWTHACLGEGKTAAPFEYGRKVTETILIGTVAMRLPKQTLEWDTRGGSFTNSAKANEYLSRPYRRGWQVAGLS